MGKTADGTGSTEGAWSAPDGSRCGALASEDPDHDPGGQTAVQTSDRADPQGRARLATRLWEETPARDPRLHPSTIGSNRGHCIRSSEDERAPRRTAPVVGGQAFTAGCPYPSIQRRPSQGARTKDEPGSPPSPSRVDAYPPLWSARPVSPRALQLESRRNLNEGSPVNTQVWSEPVVARRDLRDRR